MITVLNQEVSILNQYLAELRDEHIQQDRLRFRKNLERIGFILAVEASKKLTYQEVEVKTVLGKLNENELDQPPVILSILRAGIPLHNAFLEIFDHADNAFIGAARVEEAGKELSVNMNYEAFPNVNNREIIIVDPMLATGESLRLTIQNIKSKFSPKKIIFCGVIAHKGSIEKVQNMFPENDFFVAAVDEELNSKQYIVPGLGDAGDLAFGEKL